MGSPGLSRVLPALFLLAAAGGAAALFLSGGTGRGLVPEEGRPRPAEVGPEEGAPPPPVRRPGKRPAREPGLPASLFGTIGGDPVPPGPGAWIRVTGGGDTIRETVEEGGAFDFRQVPSGVPISVWLGPDPSGTHVCRLAEGLVLEPGERREVRFVAATRTVIRGRVRDAGGKPIPQARVAALPPRADWREAVPIAAATDDEGRFFIGLGEGQDPGRLRLVVDAVNRGYVLEELLVDPGPATEDGVRVTLRMGLVIAGRAVGPDDRPLAGASIHLLEDYRGDPERRRPVEGRIETDAEGRFRDNAYRPGVYWLFLSGDVDGKACGAVMRGVSAGDEDVLVRFPGFGGLRLRFEDETTSEPVETSRVAAQFIWGYTGEAESFEEWWSGSGAECVVPDLPAGHYRVSVRARGYEDFLGDILYVPPGEPLGPLVFRLRRR